MWLEPRYTELALLLIAFATRSAAGAEQPKRQLHRFPFPAEAYARPSGIFNAAAAWTAQGVLVMFRQVSNFPGTDGSG